MKHGIGRRLLSIVLSVMMLVSLLPTTAFAEDSIDNGNESSLNEGVGSADPEKGSEGTTPTLVTVNGSTGYATLADAIAEAVPDEDGVITYEINGKADISGNDQWISFVRGATAVKKVVFIGKEGSNAEISITSSQSILGVQGMDIDVELKDLTLSHPNGKGVNDLANATKYFACMVRSAEYTVTYNNCTFPNGVCNNQYGKTVFEDCKFTSTSGWNLWNTSTGTSELNNCTFTGARGVKLYAEGPTSVAGSVTVKNTAFNLNDTEKAAIEITKPGSVDLENVSVSGRTAGTIKKNLTDDYSSVEKMTVEATGTGISGNFTGKAKGFTAETEFNITAGTFTSAVPTKYCADGFTVVENADGNYGVESVPAETSVAMIGTAGYASLAAAIAAAKDGETVTLLADTTEDVTINENITLDLGGKTLTNTNADKATVTIDKGATATVQNGRIIGGTSYYTIQNNGTATFENVTATAGNTDSSMIDNWGTLTIVSGTYEGGLNVVKSEEGSTLTINGGKFTRDWAPTYGVTGTILVYGTTTIKNGTFIDNSNSNNARVVVTGVVEGYTSITYVEGGSFTTRSGRIFHGLGKATSDNFEVSGGTFNKSVSDSYMADGYIPVKNPDGTYGVKEGKFVAEVGSTGYETFDDAIAAANRSGYNKTVSLRENITVNHQLVIENTSGKTITLDLKDFTLTSTYAIDKNGIDKNGSYALVNNTPLIVKNGTFAAGQARAIGALDTLTLDGATVTQTLTGGHACVAFCQDGTTYTIKNSTIDGAYAVCNFANNATITISDSKLIGKGNTLYHNGSNYGLQLTVTNTTIEGNGDGCGVYISGSTSAQSNADNQNGAGGYQQAIFTGCTISGTNGVEVKYTDLTLDGCTVGATVADPSYKQDDNGPAGSGFAVVSTDNAVKNATPKPAGTVIIKGDGKYTGPVGLGSLAPVKTNYADFTDETIQVSGGTFSSAVPADYCAEGYIPVKNADGAYGVKEGKYVAEVNGVKYETLQAAINAAERKATVKMLADARENVTISTPYLTLDLNGFTLNGGTEKGKPALTVKARVTVKDSSAAQTGIIMREDTAENSGVSSHYVIDVQDGWLFFESGTVKNDSGNAKGNGASLVRVGDDSVDKCPGLTIKGGTFTQNNFIVIKVDRGDLFLNDGTLNSTSSYAIEDWHRATIKGGTVNGTVAAWTYSGGQNSDLTISGGTVNGDVRSVNFGSTKDKVAKVSITGGEVNGKLGTYTYSNGLFTEETSMATIEVTGGTFKNDPTNYVVEGSTVTQNSEGKYGVEKAYLAKVGDTSYYTMDEAFKAQTTSGKAIVMLRDYTTGSPFHSGSINRTVDLNGHTWTCTGTDANSAAFEINYSNVTLTVKNGKVVSSQLVGLIPSAMGGTIKYDNSNLVFEDVEMTANGHSGIETNGNNTNDTVTLKNSTLNVPNGFGIYFPSSGTLTIDNSVINAKTMGVQVCAGNLSINDGSEITVTGDAVPKTENDGAIQDGAAISIVNRGYKDFGEIAITGGTFKAKVAAIKAYNWNNTDKTEEDFTANETVAVSGGTFSSAVPAGLCAPGYVPANNNDGTYTVAVKAGVVAVIGDKEYETLAAATTDAKAGDTIVLVADAKGEQFVVIMSGVTLNLNGHSITGATMFYASGEVIDTSATKGVVSATSYSMNLENTYTSIYDKEKSGYSFFDLTIQSGVKNVEGDANAKAVQFRLKKDTDAALAERNRAFELLKKGVDSSRVEARVTVTWTDGDTTQHLIFVFTDDFMAQYCNPTQAKLFQVIFSGLDSIQANSIKAVASFVTYDGNNNVTHITHGKTETIK